MAKQRITHTQTFGEAMNSDTAREFMKNSQSRYQLNVHSLSSSEGDVGIIRNVKGNTNIQVSLPAGFNKLIGYASDEENHKFYSFIYNDQGYHGIYEYNDISKSISLVLQSITDFGGFDVLQFNKDYLILMADVISGNLLYWVDGLNDARKFNIKKALDKSALGYGPIVLEEYINAYKLAPAHAPEVAYFSDPAVLANYQYGSLKKFTARFYYDDNERSHFSDYSNVALPPKESYTGVNTIPTDNNGIAITVETGSRIVKKIEIGMIRTIDTGLSNWVSIAVLDKKKLKISDNSTYVYKFYNDGSYPALDPEKVIKPYSFLPRAPRCQAFAGMSMTYWNFKDGFEDVAIDTEITVGYEDLFIDSGVENKFNEPQFITTDLGVSDYLAGVFNNENYTELDGTVVSPKAKRSVNGWRVKIGNDIKKGNVFNFRIRNGANDFNISVTATVTDTPTTIANKIIPQLVSTGLIIRKSNGKSPIPEKYIYNLDNDGLGNITFEFLIIDYYKNGYFTATANVNPVQYDTLKDTGQSVSNTKLGAGFKFGIVYYDFQGRRTLVYTQDSLITKVATQNALGGLKSVVFTLTIKHIPPIWAKYYEIVRTRDLVYGDFIDLNIQKVIDVPATNSGGDYLDLVVGSLYTYQKIHPNTSLKYDFKKGDRMRLLTKADGSYYPFVESEILSFKDNFTEEVINSNIVVNGTTTVTVANASADNVGRFIVVDNNEREIVAAPSATTYTVNSPIGKASQDPYLSYRLLDRRGLLRIRKPSATLVADIDDNSLVEIFTPSLSGDELGQKQFFHFNKKFDIINPGKPNRYHSANQQQQSASQPAIVRITEGTIYVRNRELPITNQVPNAQVVIKAVEDKSYSDFYQSYINDNGRENIEDTGDGVVDFGSRAVFSNNYIENTRINGLNDFDNLDRKDYNDPYGDVVRTVYTENRILIFKELKDAWTGVFKNIITDEAGTDILGVSSKLLNEINYYSFKGGIGKNPESYCRDENWHYHVSVATGSVVRLGADGITPISDTYELDNDMKDYLHNAGVNGAKIYTGVDPVVGLIVVIEQAESRSFYSQFDQSKWITQTNYISDDAVVEILTPPAHGTLTVVDGMLRRFTATPGYVGTDNFTYRTLVNGQYLTRKVCLIINEAPNREKIWVQDPATFSCDVVDGKRTGNVSWGGLIEVYVDDNTPTGNTKANDPADPNYVAPIFDTSACSIQYGNALYSQNFTRNNCGSSATGSVVPYIVLANTFIRDTQAEADDAAVADAAANGQAFANTNGTCTPLPVFSNVVKSGTAQKQGCAPGSTGSIETYTVAAGTYTSTVSQAFVDNQAQADVDANKQAHANSVGTCIPNPIVPVNFVVSYGSNPSTMNGLALNQNGVEVERIESAASGASGVVWREGHQMLIRDIHYVTNFPWIIPSKSKLVIKLNNTTTVFDGEVSDETLVEVQSFPYTIPVGATSIDIFLTGSSTAVGYFSKTLTSNTDFAQDELRVEVTDLTDNLVRLDIKPQPGTGKVYPMNTKGTTDSLTAEVFNDSTTNAMACTITDGVTPQSFNIPIGASHVFTGLAKDSLIVTANKII